MAQVPQKCGDGKCLCIANECEKQICRTNDHCGWPNVAALCRNNQCESVGCTTHDHCKNLPEGGPTSFCKDNTCDHTAECLVTSDCPAGEPANCEENKCVTVIYYSSTTKFITGIFRSTATETLTARLTTFASARVARLSTAEPASTALITRSASRANALSNLFSLIL